MKTKRVGRPRKEVEVPIEIPEDGVEVRRRKPRQDKGEAFGNLLAGAVNGIIVPIDAWLGRESPGLSEGEVAGLSYTGKIYYENSDSGVISEKMGKLAGAMLAVSIAAVLLPRAVQAFRKLRHRENDAGSDDTSAVA